MWSVVVTGLATGALFAATALVYNVMFSTSKVLSVTTGHISMLGGVYLPYGRPPEGGVLHSEYGASPRSGLLQLRWYF